MISEISVLRNGKEWLNATTYTYKNPFTSDNRLNIQLHVAFQNAAGHWGVYETLELYKIPKKPGKVTIYDTSDKEDNGLSGAWYSTFLELGHVLGDVFRIADGIIEENFFEVIAVDEDVIEGRFELAFVEIWHGNSLPDTVIFTNGYVRSSILD